MKGVNEAVVMDDSSLVAFLKPTYLKVVNQ